MKSCGSCHTWIPDDAATCPSCGREPGAGPPPAPGLPPAGEAGPAILSRDPGTAAARVRRLGTFCIVLGAMILAMVLLSFANFASGAALRSLADARREAPPEAGWILDMLEGMYTSPLYLAVIHGLPFAMGVLCIHAGISLRALRGRTEAIVAAVLLLLPPATGGACCCVAMPLGIYALVVLLREETAAAMRR